MINSPSQISPADPQNTLRMPTELLIDMKHFKNFDRAGAAAAGGEGRERETAMTAKLLI